MAFVFFNPNPLHKRVGDCSVRAMCKALELDWDKAFLSMTVIAMKVYDMPSANYVWGLLLQQNGFSRLVIPSVCPACMTVKEFCEKHNEGTYVLCCENDHVVTVVDGDHYDTWDSSDDVVMYFYEKEGV